ncbi:SGNH/GDSL hydrolase family protein [Paenibacillus sp. VCA1]|uniref:SGNH/GDSL hydrolase family protein n=1 Tax=Paenibacillus sp. VCA1 TaxID=3039148 RepID=UPI002870F4D0|nr:SGNH/GDSL hydrolase family protein [Paenibacillus sp. VCA1]MDR9855466.1 SGNH/GDSL hydrolase family protein [Paenibacillus sp. VCA1]
MNLSATISNLENGKQQHIVVYGTSLTEGGAWVSGLKEILDRRFPGQVKLTNSAKGGQWSDWGVENLEERVIALAPDAVFLEFAINDSFLPYQTSVTKCGENLNAMIDRIHAANKNCEILLMTMNPPVREPLKIRPLIEEYYQVYRDTARKRGLLLIDHYSVWRSMLDDNPAEFDRLVPDGLHPSDEGSTKITLAEIVRTWL